VFRSVQIFLFSLIPLALVFIGVVGGSIHGQDSKKEVFPTAAAAPTSAPPGPGTPTNGAGGAGGALQITASNLMFNPRTLTARANSSVTVRMNNQDAGVLHNFAVYRNSQARDKIFAGDFSTGPEAKDYTFTAPAAGSYFFRCDVHPDTMSGTLRVQ